jgi:hypothetical protein
VTRNSHAEDIATFLTRLGVPHVPVFPVKRLQTTKADIILRRSGLWDPESGTQALFVDDSIAEHVDPELLACRNLRRVLFART